MTLNSVSESCSQQLLSKKQQHIWPCVYHFYDRPPVIVRGEGSHLYDDCGKRYLDCYSGVGVMSAGHSNREILDAAIAQMERLSHTTTIYLTEPMLRLAERIASLLPGDLETSFFCSSGTEANEAAILLASLVTERSHFVSFECGLHGRTKAAMSATALPMWRTDPSPLEEFHQAPNPSNPDCLVEVQKLFDRFDVAGVLIEPIQGNGGILVPPADFLPRLQQLCEQNGTLLIADEVQTGIGRTGDWLACQASGVVPDIVTIAKALGNGFPIAAAVTSQRLADAYRRPGASTYGGNPVSAAAALAVLDFHERECLCQRSRELGDFLNSELQARLASHPNVREIRGRGLMIGVEIQSVDGQLDGDLTGALLEQLKDAGFLLGRTGVNRNVLTIMPPLVIEKPSLTALIEALQRVLKQS